MKEFKDKIAVVTGAANGIGRGRAKKCCQKGMKVVLADINKKALSQAETELKKSGATVISILTDVSKTADVDALAQRTLDVFGAVHLLFNNAGVAVGNYLWDFTLADWQWVMGVNLWGVIHGIRTFIPIMLKQDIECHIINTSSLAGLVQGSGIYGITKHGVIALSESLAAELKYISSKIKVSVLCPGFVKTKILECERNRPSELKNNPSEVKIHPELEKGIELTRKMFETAITPRKVANIIFQAIIDGKFYILTDKNIYFKNIIKRRMRAILKAFDK